MGGGRSAARAGGHHSDLQRKCQCPAAARAAFDWACRYQLGGGFVDDNSPDGTSDAVRRIALENRHVRIVQRIGRRGLATAVVEGMLASAAPVLAVIDGDLQHDEAILPQLFEQIRSCVADVAVGTR